MYADDSVLYACAPSLRVLYQTDFLTLQYELIKSVTSEWSQKQGNIVSAIPITTLEGTTLSLWKLLNT